MTPDSAAPPADTRAKPRRLGVWFVLLALLGAIGYAFWSQRGKAPAEERGAQPGKRPTPVLVAEATVSDIPIVLEGLGTVTPIASVTVRSRVDGQLDSVTFIEGATVKRGDLLAQVDPRAFQVQLKQARATLERDRATLDNTQRDLNRYEQLGKLVTQQQVDTQRSQVATISASVKLDEAAIANAELMLQYARITAPITGVAGIRNVNPGNIVHASDTTGIVTLTQLDPISVVFTLPQDELPKVSRALATGKPHVEVFDRGGQVSLGAGSLRVLDNQVNADTGTLRLKAELPNPNRALWPNQFVKARVIIEVRTGVLSVPAAAITRGPEGEFVYVVGPDDKAEQRPIKVDSLEGERALIASGLKASERVIVDGQNQVKPGGTVLPRAIGAPRGPPEGQGPSSRGAPDSPPAKGRGRGTP